MGIRKKQAKGPIKIQKAVLYVSIAVIGTGILALLIQGMTLYGLQNPEVQANIAEGLRRSGSKMELGQAISFITTLTVVQLVVAFAALLTGIFGIRVSQDESLAAPYGKLMMVTMGLAAFGAVMSIQTGTVFMGFWLLAIVVLLAFYVKKAAAEYAACTSRKGKKKR